MIVVAVQRNENMTSVFVAKFAFLLLLPADGAGEG